MILAAFGAAQAVEGASETRPRGKMRQYGAAEICRDLNLYEALKPTVPMLLRLRQGQMAAWSGLDAALKEARPSLDKGCTRLGALPATGAATAQAARLEVVLAASLEALRRVRPAFDRFYAGLDGEQRRQVDSTFDGYRL
jgi:hypothetical protein